MESKIPQGRLPAIVLIGLSLAILFPIAASTQSPKEVLYSEEVLHRAYGDISTMDAAELTSLTNYLAECGDELSENEIIQHSMPIGKD